MNDFCSVLILSLLMVALLMLSVIISTMMDQQQEQPCPAAEWLIQERADLEAALVLHAEALYSARREAIYYRIQYDPGIRGMSARDIELEVYGPVK